MKNLACLLALSIFLGIPAFAQKQTAATKMTMTIVPGQPLVIKTTAILPGSSGGSSPAGAGFLDRRCCS